jgi:hypothetical protein
MLRLVELLERSGPRDDRDRIASAEPGRVVNVYNYYISSPNTVLSSSAEAIVMRDNYTENTGIVGPHASAHDVSITQWKQVASDVDLPLLAQELEQVMDEMRRTAGEEPDQYQSIAAIAGAKNSAKSNDGPAAMNHLRKAGKWALDIATSIGAGVAIAAIKAAMGL